MDTNFILTQVFGTIALIFVCIAYFQRSRQAFLFLNIVGNFFYAVAFLFQGLFVAGIGTFLSLARTIGLYVYKDNNKTSLMTYFLIIIAGYFINASLFYQNPWDLIALCTNCMFTVAFFTKNLRLTRYLMILPNALLVVYNIFNFCYASAALDCIEVAVAISSVIMFEIKRKKGV